MHPIDLNTIDWEKLLAQPQSGSGHYIGQPYQRGGQRGKGLGGVLASLFKMIPMFLSSPIGQEVLSAGKAVATDIMDGKPLKGTLKQHGRQTVRNLTGLGHRKGIKRPAAVLKPHIKQFRLSKHVKAARRQIPNDVAAGARL